MATIRQKKKRNWRSITGTVLFITLAASIIYVLVQLVTAPETTTELGEHTRSDYVLMLLQCTLGLVVMFLPSLLERRLNLQLPGSMYIMYCVFLYCAIYLGEVRSFYYNIPFWDSILHAFSGAMLGALGFSVVDILNKDKRVAVHLSPAFVALFALCFAVTLGVVWEVYEYVADGLLGLNMQKFALQDGTPLDGRAALADTMKDLIIDFIGAFIMSAIGYFSIKHGTDFIKKFTIKRIKKDPSSPK